ncbi:MAG: FHA domain-containing protein [Actinomycetota bacterium]|nr:FHA domain-containing protein [Actinomycetota bacterium]MEC8334447.1 FHA domain-containing protein [Actinomycetota bacterium]|tara:strand:- start:2400 stop:2777 length:378 start_codon:yes stop_codon:yes gene_type:complete
MSEDSANEDPTETLSIDDIANADEKVTAAGFIVTDGPIAGSKYLLDAGRSTIGRHPESSIFFDDITVSRRHAEVTLSGNEVKVTDVGSLNGTYLNQRQIDSSQQLVPGDVLQIGKFKLVYFQESN